jgi:hypothetical protein
MFVAAIGCSSDPPKEGVKIQKGDYMYAPGQAPGQGKATNK